MRILVTGSAGFIGSYVSRKLISLGHDVVGIDNFHKFYDIKAKKLNNEITSNEKGGSYIFIKCDIRERKPLEDIFKDYKFDAIIHLAAMAGVKTSIENPKLYTEVNIDGSVNILDFSVKYNIDNLVFASSSSVYGNTDKVPFNEKDNVDNPISPYAATKRAMEIISYTYSYLYSLNISLLRFFTVYGPLQRPYGMAIQKFIKQVDHNQAITIYGDGSMGRDYTYIDDIIDGIVGALENPNGYEIYNLGNSSPVTVKELAEKIIKTFGKGEIKHLDLPATEVPITFADISKAKQNLGYNPKVSIDEGLKKQIDKYKSMPKWYKDLEG